MSEQVLSCSLGRVNDACSSAAQHALAPTLSARTGLEWSESYFLVIPNRFPIWQNEKCNKEKRR